MTFSYSVRIELIIVPDGLILVSTSALAPFIKQPFKQIIMPMIIGPR